MKLVRRLGRCGHPFGRHAFDWSARKNTPNGKVYAQCSKCEVWFYAAVGSDGVSFHRVKRSPPIDLRVAGR